MYRFRQTTLRLSPDFFTIYSHYSQLYLEIYAISHLQPQLALGKQTREQNQLNTFFTLQMAQKVRARKFWCIATPESADPPPSASPTSSPVTKSRWAKPSSTSSAAEKWFRPTSTSWGSFWSSKRTWPLRTVALPCPFGWILGKMKKRKRTFPQKEGRDLKTWTTSTRRLVPASKTRRPIVRPLLPVLKNLIFLPNRVCRRGSRESSEIQNHSRRSQTLTLST